MLDMAAAAEYGMVGKVLRYVAERACMMFVAGRNGLFDEASLHNLVPASHNTFRLSLNDGNDCRC